GQLDLGAALAFAPDTRALPDDVTPAERQRSRGRAPAMMRPLLLVFALGPGDLVGLDLEHPAERKHPHLLHEREQALLDRLRRDHHRQRELLQRDRRRRRHDLLLPELLCGFLLHGGSLVPEDRLSWSTRFSGRPRSRRYFTSSTGLGTSPIILA